MKGEQLVGRLATGIGMGTTFTQLDWAKAQFRDRVGIDPFPGTINVIVDDPDSMPVWVRLKRTDGIHMDNPNDGPHDCDAKCWPVSINGEIDGAIVYPLVDGYPSAQIEVIAAIGVRDAFQIEDGDTVTLTLKG
ncbi:MAG: CTP-dependent riboflavin kinase [Proteobacteria bacterium]|nr:CTP-dependent riboflavin kinase [Pseudomonadota bacterium]